MGMGGPLPAGWGMADMQNAAAAMYQQAGGSQAANSSNPSGSYTFDPASSVSTFSGSAYLKIAAYPAAWCLSRLPAFQVRLWIPAGHLH